MTHKSCTSVIRTQETYKVTTIQLLDTVWFKRNVSTIPRSFYLDWSSL